MVPPCKRQSSQYVRQNILPKETENDKTSLIFGSLLDPAGVEGGKAKSATSCGPPQGAFFASEEAQLEPAESEVYFRSGSKHFFEVFVMSHHIATV